MPLVRRTDSVAATARRRELTAAARRRELTATPGKEVVSHCPTQQDLLASSTDQYCTKNGAADFHDDRRFYLLSRSSPQRLRLGSLDVDHRPCFARFSGDLNSQSDVYAFGVVLLEVLTGRPALDRRLVEEHHNLATWAINYMRKGNVDDIVDYSLARGAKDSTYPQDSRRGALALTLRALVEILRRVFGGDHSNLEHQVVAAGSDSGDAPPLEESPDADPVELGDTIFFE
nr:receptor-like protein kinase FERONIA [Ipomoea trifida]